MLLCWNYVGTQVCRHDARVTFDVLRSDTHEVGGSSVRLPLDGTPCFHVEVHGRVYQHRIRADVGAIIDSEDAGYGRGPDIGVGLHAGSTDLHTGRIVASVAPDNVVLCLESCYQALNARGNSCRGFVVREGIEL